MSFLAAGVLAAFVFRVLVDILAPIASGPVARVLAGDFVVHVAPVLIGFLVFVVLQFNKKVIVWGDDVVNEIRKVVWPSRRDTVAMTIVVCVMVLVSAVIIGTFDIISRFFVN